MVVSKPSAALGRDLPAFMRRNAPVPYVFFPEPGDQQPWPNNAACWSPATPQMDASMPRTERLVVPKSPLERRTSGSSSRGTPNSSQSSSLHAWLLMSYNIVRDAFVGSV